MACFKVCDYPGGLLIRVIAFFNELLLGEGGLRNSLVKGPPLPLKA